MEAAGVPAGGPAARPRWSRGRTASLFDAIPARSARTLRVWPRRYRAVAVVAALRTAPTDSHCPHRAPNTEAPCSQVSCRGLSGGGGSRTRVRESIHQSVYARIALLCSLPDPARTMPTRASCLSVSPPMGQHHREASPNFRRLQESPRAGSSGDGLQDKDESLRSQCQVIVGSCKVSRWIFEVPGPRHAAPISQNTSKPCRPLMWAVIIAESMARPKPGPAPSVLNLIPQRRATVPVRAPTRPSRRPGSDPDTLAAFRASPRWR